MFLSRLTAGLLALSLSSGVLHATVIVPADLTELVDDARAIVLGRVVATEAQWADGRRQIETLVTLAAGEYLKGDLGREVTFKVPGGQLGPYRSVMLGAPRFKEGEEVVLFFGTRGPRLPWIVGFNQGVYRVTADAAGNRMVVPGVAASRGHNPERLVRGERQAIGLQAFADQVRRLVRERRAR